MRKSIAGILASALLLIPVQFTNAVSPKAGASCSKLSQTQVASGFKYTCIKSGKKLVWSKGVKVVTPTPTKSPTPTPTNSNSQATIQALPQAPSSFEELGSHLSGIIYGAWLKGSTKINGSTFKIDNIHFIQGPHTILNEQDSHYLSAIDAVQKIFSEIPQSKNVYLIYYGIEDRDWAQSQFEKYMDASYGYGNRSTVAADNCPLPNCNGGMAVHTNNFDTIILIGDNNGWAWDNNTRSQGYLGHTFAHEYTHTIQLFNMNPNWGNIPSWLREGTAEWAATIAVNYEDYSGYTNYREKTDLGMQYGNTSTYTKQYIYNFLNPELVFKPGDDINSYTRTFPHWDSYSLGLMSVEALVSIKGPNALISLLQDINQGKNFADAFEQEFGAKWSTAGSLIADAIYAEIQQSVKR